MNKSPKMQVISSDIYRRCISIIIEMKRNLIEYKNAFGHKCPDILCFDLNEIPSIETSDNQKRVIIRYDVDTDKYCITTLFDGNKLSNEVSSDKLPVSTIVTLFELFNDIRTYWCAYEKFAEQQQAILINIPVEYIVGRLTKYLEKNKVSIYSVGKKYDIPAGSTTINDVSISEFLVRNNISYLDIYSSIFFNIDDY